MESYEDWYGVRYSQFTSIKGGYQALTYYDHSLLRALWYVYIDVPWHRWRFDKVPTGYWSHQHHVDEYFEWLSDHLKIDTLDRWYTLECNDLRSCYGSTLLSLASGSIKRMLETHYPEYSWQWHLQDHKNYVATVSKELKIKQLADWYNVTYSDLTQIAGWDAFVRQYNGSLFRVLETFYPTYPWQPWRLGYTQKGVWNYNHNIEKFIKWLPKELGIVTDDDWYSVTFNEVKELKGIGFIRNCGGLHKFVKKYYGVDLHSFKNANRIPAKEQIALYKILRNIFPGKDVFYSYKHPELLYPNTQKRIELDLYVPHLAFALEYQGDQHHKFKPTCGPPEIQQKRDNDKKNACIMAGITLITVSSDVIHKEKSLLKLIQQHCPSVTVEIAVDGKPAKLQTISA